MMLSALTAERRSKLDPSNSVTPSTVYCIACGSSIGEENRFCPSCGEEQPLAYWDEDQESSDHARLGNEATSSDQATGEEQRTADAIGQHAHDGSDGMLRPPQGPAVTTESADTDSVSREIQFKELSPVQRGAIDPAIEYVAWNGEPKACRFLDLAVDAEAHPVLPDGETFSSRWLGAGGLLYGAALGENELACFGGCHLGVTERRLVGCWYNGLQGLDEEAGSLDKGETAIIIASWSFDSLSQLFIEGRQRMLRGFEASKMRVFGGQRGDQLVLEAIMPADEEWLGPHEHETPDHRTQYAAFAKSTAQAWAKSTLRSDQNWDRAYVEGIASGNEELWRVINSPFVGGETAIMIELTDAPDAR
jgi:hypothetical protein